MLAVLLSVCSTVDAFLARRRLVFHLHDIISDSHFSTMNRFALIGSANAFAHAVIANSEATQQAFLAAGGRCAQLAVVPNGFKITDTRSSETVLHDLRKHLDLPEGAWTVLMAGRLTPWKGQHVLLKALQELPDAHAIFLGDALFTEEDRQYARELRETASQAPLERRVHFAGFRKDTEIRMVDVAPTNTRIYHHGILYLALASDAAKLKQLEAEDPEPGYECFGGPGAGTGEWVTGEAVGKLTRPYPDGTAKVIPAGAKFVLQLHYNTINGQGSDRSKVLLWKAPRPVNRAPVDVRLVNFLFNIPAGSPRTTATAEAAVVADGQSGGLLRITAPEGKLWQVWGHMHMLGSSFTLDLLKPDGSKRRLLDIPDWQFNWQGVYDLVTPIDLKAGETIRMTCTWDNSQANQPYVDGKQQAPRAVRWGEGTLDEMCLGGVTVTK